MASFDGYKGLIYGKFRMLTGSDFSGIPDKGRHHPGEAAACRSS